MKEPNLGRFWFRVAIAGILGLIFLAVEATAQPPGYRKVCTASGCRLVPIAARPASVRRFLPLRRGGRRFTHSLSRPARHAQHLRVGRFWR